MNDEHAVDVDLSEDPYDDLPRRVTDELERFILIEDWEEACDRVELLRCLLDDWDSLLDDDDARSAWLADHGGQDYLVSRNERGNLVAASMNAEFDPTQTLLIPEAMTRVLQEELLAVDSDRRLARSIAARSLIGEWSDLLIDNEKLVGHLLLVHEIEVDVATLVSRGEGTRVAFTLEETDQDQLLRLHSASHAAE